jgi:hypothetical protein
VCLLHINSSCPDGKTRRDPELGGLSKSSMPSRLLGPRLACARAIQLLPQRLVPVRSRTPIMKQCTGGAGRTRAEVNRPLHRKPRGLNASALGRATVQRLIAGLAANRDQEVYRSDREDIPMRFDPNAQVGRPHRRSYQENSEVLVQDYLHFSLRCKGE